MTSDVFFLSVGDLTGDGLKALFEKSGFSKYFIRDDIVAIKLHFGEMGNTAYLKPRNVKPVYEKLVELGTKPFLTDSNTLYRGTRANSVDHLNTAFAHGYDFAPVIIADGLEGKEYVKVSVGLKHFKEVNIGSMAANCGKIMVLSHFKGHELTGFGGALKNVGMGLGSRSGKQLMHSDVSPQVVKDKCTSCGLCLKWCPTDAIEMKEGKAFIDRAKCIGCAECIATCRFEAIDIAWEGSSASVQEKIAEYTCGAVKGKTCCYMNYIIDVSPNCDCWNYSDPAIVGDIGVVASTDPIAIDQASLDLTSKKAGYDPFKKTWPQVDNTVQLAYGESIGLGSRKYRLISV